MRLVSFAAVVVLGRVLVENTVRFCDQHAQIVRSVVHGLTLLLFVAMGTMQVQVGSLCIVSVVIHRTRIVTKTVVKPSVLGQVGLLVQPKMPAQAAAQATQEFCRRANVRYSLQCLLDVLR